MTSVNSYLTFNGNCEKAFNFYKTAFKSEFEHIGRFKDMPADPNFEVSEADKEKVMHVSLPIGNTTLMGSGQWHDRHTYPPHGTKDIFTVSERKIVTICYPAQPATEQKNK